MTKEMVLGQVAHSPSSIFTKEDVIKLIDSIQGVGRVITVTEIGAAIDGLVSSLENNEDEIVDRDSIELSIGAYDNRIEVDNIRINFDYIREALENTFMDFGEAEEEV